MGQRSVGVVPRPSFTLRLFLPDVAPHALYQLRALLPGLTLTPLGLDIPLTDRAPEEILAVLLRCGVTARATRIVADRSASG